MKTRLLRFSSKMPAFRILLAVVLFTTSVLVLSSCYKDRFNLDKVQTSGEWSPDVCAPLINSKLGMDDILNDYDYHNLHAEDGSGFLYLIYEDKVSSETAEKWLIIPDQPVNTNYTVAVVGGLPFTGPAYDNDYEFLMPNGEKITEVNIKAGGLAFNIPGGAFDQNATITLSIPGATKNGIPLSYTLNFINGVGINETIDLAGYRLVFNNVSPNNNMLKMTYSAVITASGLPLNTPLTIPMGESFVNLKYSSIYGDFKQHIFNLENDSVKIRLFQNVLHGSVDFQNPKLHIITNNSCGMPLGVNLTDFQAVSYVNPSVDVKRIPDIPWSLAALGSGTEGQFLASQSDFDKYSSNVNTAVYSSPKWFLSKISALSNPAGGASSNFLLDTSRFDVNVQVDIPLFGKAMNFILQDTMAFSFGEDMNKVESLLFRINADNGFPVDAVMQIYFVSENNVFLDSLLIPAQQVIRAANVGGAPDYRVVDKIHTLTESSMSQPRIGHLSPTKKLIVRAVCNTVNSGTELTKFYSSYTLDVRLAVRAKFRIDF